MFKLRSIMLKWMFSAICMLNTEKGVKMQISINLYITYPFLIHISSGMSKLYDGSQSQCMPDIIYIYVKLL